MARQPLESPGNGPEFSRHRQAVRIVAVIIIGLLIGAIVMGVLSAREMKSMLSEDFNAQQLALARHAASIRNERECLICIGFPA